MDRKLLEDLGLEKEAIDKVMAEHGKALNAKTTELEEAQTKATNLEAQLEERNNDIQELKKNATSDEDLKTKLEDLEAKYQTETEQLQTQLEQNKKLAEIRLNINKAGAKNEKAVMALLDQEQIKINDDGVQGLKEQIEALQETDAYLFKSENPPSGQSTLGGNNGGGAKPPKGNAFKDAASKFLK